MARGSSGSSWRCSSAARLALIHAFFSIHLRADQIVSGTAINFLALGLTGYLFRYIYGTEGTPSDVARIPTVTIPLLDRIPFVGDVIGTMSLMIWLMLALLILSWAVLFKTPIGLRIRSVGEHPKAADTVGISVYGIRYACVVLSGMLAALGGAYLSIGFVGSFNENMTVGRGYIALAAVIFGKWRPFPAFAACLLFGFSSGLAQRLQNEAGHLRQPPADPSVRPHAHRARRRRRPLPRPGRRRPPVRQAVSRNPKAVWAFVTALAALGVLLGGLAAAHYSGDVGLYEAMPAVPVGLVLAFVSLPSRSAGPLRPRALPRAGGRAQDSQLQPASSGVLR